MAEKMRAGYYCGPINHLAGRRAIIRTGVEGVPATHVMAQFDDPVSVNCAQGYIAMGSALNCGWHKFPVAEFDLDIEYE